jgi:tetratricopeptide (TPR) repeat protein
MKASTVLAVIAAIAACHFTFATSRAEDINSMPPVVVKTLPESGAKDVGPGVVEIKVTFSKEMTDGSWSWTTAWQGSTPEMVGQPQYESDRKTCALKVRLEPGKTYAYWLNSAKFQNFRDKQGHPAVPYLLVFQTRGVGDASALTQEGWRLWQDRRLSEAAAKFNQAVEVAPNDANAWNGLGWAYFNSGKSDEAEKAFQKVVSLEPGHPAASNGLGQLYLSKREYDRAEPYLLKAAPQAPAAWYGLARLYLIEGKFDQAERWARNLVDSGQADNIATQMLKAAQSKNLSEGLRLMIEPQPAR